MDWTKLWFRWNIIFIQTTSSAWQIMGCFVWTHFEPPLEHTCMIFLLDHVFFLWKMNWPLWFLWNSLCYKEASTWGILWIYMYPPQFTWVGDWNLILFSLILIHLNAHPNKPWNLVLIASYHYSLQQSYVYCVLPIPALVVALESSNLFDVSSQSLCSSCCSQSHLNNLIPNTNNT